MEANKEESGGSESVLVKVSLSLSQVESNVSPLFIEIITIGNGLRIPSRVTLELLPRNLGFYSPNKS